MGKNFGAKSLIWVQELGVPMEGRKKMLRRL